MRKTPVRKTHPLIKPPPAGFTGARLGSFKGEGEKETESAVQHIVRTVYKGNR